MTVCGNAFLYLRLQKILAEWVKYVDEYPFFVTYRAMQYIRRDKINISCLEQTTLVSNRHLKSSTGYVADLQMRMLVHSAYSSL